jgi:hypothetical protein
MAMIEDGTAKTVGDPTILAKIGAAMVTFDPRFPIMPGTRLMRSDEPASRPRASRESVQVSVNGLGRGCLPFGTPASAQPSAGEWRQAVFL